VIRDDSDGARGFPGAVLFFSVTGGYVTGCAYGRVGDGEVSYILAGSGQMRVL
jgi:hypothetical protein